jgi:hypothetical protein
MHSSYGVEELLPHLEKICAEADEAAAGAAAGSSAATTTEEPAAAAEVGGAPAATLPIGAP